MREPLVALQLIALALNSYLAVTSLWSHAWLAAILPAVVAGFAVVCLYAQYQLNRSFKKVQRLNDVRAEEILRRILE